MPTKEIPQKSKQDVRAANKARRVPDVKRGNKSRRRKKRGR